MPLEDDPGDIGATDAVGGKLGIGAGVHPPEIIRRPLRLGGRIGGRAGGTTKALPKHYQSTAKALPKHDRNTPVGIGRQVV